MVLFLTLFTFNVKELYQFIDHLNLFWFTEETICIAGRTFHGRKMTKIDCKKYKARFPFA